jgi:hypothetical protein
MTRSPRDVSIKTLILLNLHQQSQSEQRGTSHLGVALFAVEDAGGFHIQKAIDENRYAVSRESH